MEPAWSQKSREGKMFTRFECDACAARFNFMETIRATRSPRCPVCGSTSAREAA